jgi:hypothetical protein
MAMTRNIVYLPHHKRPSAKKERMWFYSPPRNVAAEEHA